MIADGKVNKDTRVNVDNYNKCSLGYVFEDGRNIFKWLDEDFEILEYKTEEIEELDMTYTHHNIDYTEIINKINGLVRAINKLNKPIDTSKETNCMTD